MAECDYCGKSFENETALLTHLGEEHEGELGRIDRRRVAEVEEGSRLGRPVWIGIAVVALLALLAAVYLLIFSGSGGQQDRIETQPLPERGDQSVIASVQTHPSHGNAHVEPGTEIEYESIPPTSGTHYPTTVDAGFYEETPPLGALVHSLEHGAVVIYYDPNEIDAATKESLRAFASTHTDQWASVIVVPHPQEGSSAPIVLTAWRHSLRLEEYDPETVRAFLGEYLGRGPEHAVR